MREIIRTNDPVLLSFVEWLLRAAGIGYIVADRHISVLEGSIGAFPRRVVVAPQDETAARRVLAEADLGAELRPAPDADMRRQR